MSFRREERLKVLLKLGDKETEEGLDLGLGFWLEEKKTIC